MMRTAPIVDVFLPMMAATPACTAPDGPVSRCSEGQAVMIGRAPAPVTDARITADRGATGHATFMQLGSGLHLIRKCIAQINTP